MGEWTLACRLIDIPLLGTRRITRAQGLPVALFRNDGDLVFALLDHCPHCAAPLSQGLVLGEGVLCPRHDWIIRFKDGCAQEPHQGCTPRFRVKVEAGQVWLRSDELSSHALDGAASTP